MKLGPDLWYIFIVEKFGCKKVTYPLTKLLNNTGVFPLEWKHSNVAPVFKSGYKITAAILTNLCSVHGCKDPGEDHGKTII